MAERVDDVETVDLREYLDIIRRYFWLIAGILAVVVVGTAFSSRGAIPLYEAKASLLVGSSMTEVSFEPKIKTSTTTGIASSNADAGNALRQTLVQLVPNTVVEASVASTLASALQPEERQPGGLVGKIKGKVNPEGNILEIRVTTEDPGRSTAIANAWAAAFVSYANHLYRGFASSSTFIDELSLAKIDYEKAQTAYTQFVGETSETALTYSLREKEAVLGALQEGKAIAVRSIVSSTVGLQSKLVAEYANNYSANRLIALSMDRDATHKLLSSYFEAANSATAEAFGKQAAAKLQTLQSYYELRQRVERLLSDAQALRQQVMAGPVGPGTTASSGVAIALLKAEAFAASGGVPASLQIHLNFDGAFGSNREAQLQDLDALVKVLSDRRSQLDIDIQQKLQEIASRQGYQIFESPGLAQDPLSDAAKRQYQKLFESGPLTLLGEQTANSSNYMDQISQQARAVLELPDMAKMWSGQADTSPGQTAALVEDINRARQLLLQEQSKGTELVRARDLAWETYQSLARKSAEVAVSSQTSTAILRQAAPAIKPSGPVPTDDFKRLSVSAFAGLIGAVIAAFAIDYFRKPGHARLKGS